MGGLVEVQWEVEEEGVEDRADTLPCTAQHHPHSIIQTQALRDDYEKWGPIRLESEGRKGAVGGMTGQRCEEMSVGKWIGQG